MRKKGNTNIFDYAGDNAEIETFLYCFCVIIKKTF